MSTNSDMEYILRAERAIYRLKGRGLFRVPAKSIKSHFRTIKFITIMNDETPVSEAVKKETGRCLRAVLAEPELPGKMPDDMWEAIRNDRDAVENAIRLAVQQTKANIRDRIIG